MRREAGLKDVTVISRRSQRSVIKDILVLYYNRRGSTRTLAEAIARGIESTDGAQVCVRTMPAVSTVCEAMQPNVPDGGPPYVEIGDLGECVGLALGSPTCFGNMAASLKYFLGSTTPQWLAGAPADKLACVFTSMGSMHGGQETTLLSMMLPLLHHNMVVLGLPYQHSGLLSTEAGGTPYGPSHVAHRGDTVPLTTHERTLAAAIGWRLA